MNGTNRKKDGYQGRKTCYKEACDAVYNALSFDDVSNDSTQYLIHCHLMMHQMTIIIMMNRSFYCDESIDNATPKKYTESKSQIPRYKVKLNQNVM